jgi:hypothetical protein
MTDHKFVSVVTFGNSLDVLPFTLIETLNDANGAATWAVMGK